MNPVRESIAKQSIIFLSSFVVFFLPSDALSSENIRVVIADNQKGVVLKSPVGLMVEGQASRGIEKKIIFGAEYAGNRPVRARSIDGSIVVNGRSYRGWIEIRKKKNGLLLVVNDLDIEEYLMGVIAEEMPHDWESEALKAQAVASRTYAIYQKRSAGNRPYHIVATVNGQMYGGKRSERRNAVKAVRETEGMVIAYNGDVIPAFYHSSCGGHTEDASHLWDVDEPYLKGVDCDCQEISRYGEWEVTVSLAKIAAALGQRGYGPRDIISVSIGSITPAGRVRDVAVKHKGEDTALPAETLRAAIGYSVVPSVFFELETKGNELVISGRGRGHGVGMCQWGARQMAQKGHDYKSILRRYYPGTTVMRRTD